MIKNRMSKTKLKMGSDFINLLQAHRSIRKYQAREIDQSLFESILVAGQSASTSSYVQAVSMVRVSEASLRSQFAELAGGQPYIESCAEFIVFCADFHRNSARIRRINNEEADFSSTEQFITATVDVALCAQNVVAAAESVGLGCCYIGGIRNDPSKVTKLLELPKLVYPIFGLCLGYPAQDPEVKPRLPLAAQLHQNCYQLDERMHQKIDDYDRHIYAYYDRRTKGKLKTSWSELMVKQALGEKRKFMKKYIEKQGFNKI